jgi:hypothetical protein
MKLVNIREIFTPNSTIGKLQIDGVNSGILILEPTDLGLDNSMELTAIADIKAKHLADKKEYVAIPTGAAYKLCMYVPPTSFMSRFPLFVEKAIKKIPLFEGIKGYGGVLIHPGAIEIATHQQSEGCQMPALKLGTVPDTTAESNEGWLALMAKCAETIEAGEATYEATREPNAWDKYKATINL